MPRVALLMLFLLAACSTDGYISNPVVRKFTWFSFVQGDDLRTGCEPGAPGRYRIIFNANYVEQVRVYDLGAGRADHMSQRVIQGGGIGSWELGEPFAPWSGKTAEVDLGSGPSAALIAALERAGAFGPPAEGLELESRSFFWTVAACHQGRYHFTAWPQSAPPTFAAAIAAVDATGVPFNPPRIVPAPLHTEDPVLEFRLKVGKNGLWGVP